MANGALRAPGMTGPKPVAGPQLARQTSWASAIRLKDAGGQLADSVFYAVVLFCALAILAVVGLVLYELVSKSQLSWHAFGLKFFFGQNWDPVNDGYISIPQALTISCDTVFYQLGYDFWGKYRRANELNEL